MSKEAMDPTSYTKELGYRNGTVQVSHRYHREATIARRSCTKLIRRDTNEQACDGEEYECTYLLLYVISQIMFDVRTKAVKVRG